MLGIEVTDPELDQWRSWLMPPAQPYWVPRELAAEHGWPDGAERLSLELRDSFWLYGGDDQAVVWLDRRTSRQLPTSVRRGQPGAHRWPSPDRQRDIERTIRFVEEGRRPSRHREVADWTEISTVLPAASGLAGTFAARSGPNCFGTVMAAAGVPGAEDEWMQLQPFEAWLTECTEPGGTDSDLGTVLVWRDATGQLSHAAVTLGGGWLLHKPSQGWMSPRKVLEVANGKMSSRMPGRYLSRRRLIR